MVTTPLFVISIKTETILLLFLRLLYLVRSYTEKTLFSKRMVPLQVVPPCLKTYRSPSAAGLFANPMPATSCQSKTKERLTRSRSRKHWERYKYPGIFRLTVLLSLPFHHVLPSRLPFSLALERRMPSNTPRSRALLALLVLEYPSRVLSFVDG
jgi:hypothetical protein